MPVLSGLFSYKAHRAPTKLVARTPFQGLVCVENNSYSRQSGNPETCKCLKRWIPAFAGMTSKCVVFLFRGSSYINKNNFWLAEKNNTESKLEINK